MSAPVEGRAGMPPALATRRQAARSLFQPRSGATDWPATRQARGEVLAALSAAPFALPRRNSAQIRRGGLDMLLDWLEAQPGDTWQQRWLASGVETSPAAWRTASAAWLDDRAYYGEWRQLALNGAVVVAVSADIVRPSLAWLVRGALGKNGALVRHLARGRDPDGFARLRALCAEDPTVRAAAGSLSAYRAALILAAKGGTIVDITVGDVLELLDAEADTRKVTSATTVFYRMLHQMGIFGTEVPGNLRQLRATGQRSPEELIDRYHLACRPVRDLLVEYLRERQPALDYTSLNSLANYLGNLFWADIEAHHPGADSLRLPVEVADAWKRRLRTMTKTVITQSGDKTVVSVPRVNYRECLTPVRALYLDLAQWAAEDPQHWGQWVAPCPVGEEEINRRKDKRQRKSRMDARTRERLPVLPVLVAAVDKRRKAAEALLNLARQTQPGDSFVADGQSLVRSLRPHAAASTVWVEDPLTGKRRELSLEEDRAFWTWAAVEVLRATGVRVEELLELSHHSLVQYRLPSTGELVPLLQIAPSKTDAERLLVVSPELAEVLAVIIARIRDHSGAIPLVPAYDVHECVWSAPAPLLFQRRYSTERRAITADGVRQLLRDALAHSGAGSVDGTALRYTPHDFRRMFITDAVLNGLPPHIAQVIVGHRDINVTLGYKAVYPQEAIKAHLAFLARRRSVRPSEEYRAPTDEEWQEFLGHFERRKVSIGTCARAFSTPCIHEHACVRCPMLWPDPDQRPRLVELRDNLVARVVEAEREGWLGEVEGLQVSLAGADEKLAQIERRSHAGGPAKLAMSAK